jgi:4-hydroxy-tetrahydrodipicolinate synthase
MEGGCEGIIAFGTTGEGTFFSASEKIAATAQLIKEGVPPDRIILATGACALSDAVSIATAAHDQGLLAALVLPPFFTKGIDDTGLSEWMATLVAKTPRRSRLYLYHIPAVAGVGFTPALARQLLDRSDGAICGVKDSSPDSSLAKPLAAERRENIYVSTEVGLAANANDGIAGTISASINLTLPFVRRALAGDDAADRTTAAIRAHLAKHGLVWAVKTAIADQTGDAAWRKLAPPHTAPAGVDEAEFLARLRDISEAAP